MHGLLDSFLATQDVPHNAKLKFWIMDRSVPLLANFSAARLIKMIEVGIAQKKKGSDPNPF